jgi:hypothetical protein
MALQAAEKVGKADPSGSKPARDDKNKGLPANYFLTTVTWNCTGIERGG